ncbi:Protein of uncharacterised function (DUF406) [Providencia rustigianii]|uniref:DUF406 family protein n=2 Tax=Providencia rustigianii TaxID=158850 RepID=D1P319_9GAMM|nr:MULTISPECIES: YfcZ/YiiS family protein [Providencia]EFB72208.1 hypothetical protein PROVRUST_06607 [Providencia rustigianii DSM 4541]MTC57918.1 DUF406 family protein [Providencia rustigianii]MTC59328.1 DUF406 family protein [Providencia rustigianii]SPY78043.1 Protein of uncharacterised function (DUF406) [Providencia rustigianii]SUC27595.1 Protein of uncharacterised function (DUF406) [Providencia rustigianii]
MTDAIKRCSADETAACCCVDVGTVLENKDCTAAYQNVFATQQEAEAMLKTLTEKARSVESEPCEIKHSINSVAGGVELTAEFAFSCEAESLIFQLGLR